MLEREQELINEAACLEKEAEQKIQEFISMLSGAKQELKDTVFGFQCDFSCDDIFFMDNSLASDFETDAIILDNEQYEFEMDCFPTYMTQQVNVVAEGVERQAEQKAQDAINAILSKLANVKAEISAIQQISDRMRKR